MSIKDEQAKYYLVEAELTIFGAKAIMEKGENQNKKVWASVVKNAYDAMENAVAAAIAKKGIFIPKEHPEKITTFVDAYRLYNSEIDSILSKWVVRRSRSQYVDIKHGKVLVPHLFFTKGDAEEIIKDAERVIEVVKKLIAS